MDDLYLQQEKIRKVYEIWEEGECTLHFKNFKGIQLIVEYNIENEKGIFFQGKGNHCSIEIKKRKVKNQTVVKNYYIR